MPTDATSARAYASAQPAPPLIIRVYADAAERHLQPLLAGLVQLHRDGAVALDFRLRLRRRPRPYAPHTLWLETYPQGLSAAPECLCFDMADWPEIASLDGLRQCDRYYKRSLSRTASAALPATLACRLRPYGLYLPCATEHLHQPLRRTLLYLLAHGQGAPWRRPGAADLRRQLSLWAPALRRLGRRRPDSPLQTVNPTALFPERDTPGDGTLVFSARVFAPTAVEGMSAAAVTALNEQRAALVRALRGAFGARFRGGLEPCPVSRERYADCLMPARLNRRDYLQQMQHASVGISTSGLHSSCGAKLAEYLAAGRCVVAEPPQSVLPEPLRAGLHFLPFSEPAQAVWHCQVLLDDATAQTNMRRANLAWSRRHLQPDRLLRQALGLNRASQAVP